MGLFCIPHQRRACDGQMEATMRCRMAIAPRYRCGDRMWDFCVTEMEETGRELLRTWGHPHELGGVADSLSSRTDQAAFTEKEQRVRNIDGI